MWKNVLMLWEQRAVRWKGLFRALYVPPPMNAPGGRGSALLAEEYLCRAPGKRFARRLRKDTESSFLCPQGKRSGCFQSPQSSQQ